MRIGIDTQSIIAQKTGLGGYVQNLISALKKIDSKNEYIFLSSNKKGDLTTPARIWWDQVVFPARALFKKVDIIHKPAFSAPVFCPRKTVVTVPDLIGKLYPENFSPTSRFYWAYLLPFSLKKAHKIIAISKNTKQDIMSLLKIPEEKIVVIHLAVGKEFRPIVDIDKIASIKKKYNTGDKFILDVGTLEPRKNLPFLVKAFDLAIKKGKIEHNLVLTGKKGWYYEDLFNLIQELHLENRVILPGYVSDEDLPVLYNAADLFCFPSLYEGFGLTPLEAMASGTPVIAAKNSSIPEVVGDAGILLATKEETLWAENIIKVLSNPKILTDLRNRGLKRAQKFSWEKTARETIKIYNEVTNYAYN
jgi:glycosyltransferase involved in cell wall biosynthesis